MATDPSSFFYLQRAYEKLSSAVGILATSPEGELRASFCRLRSAVTAKAAEDSEDQITATLAGRHRTTLAKIAQECFDLYNEVSIQREFVR
jgi:hypothetical protein